MNDYDRQPPQDLAAEQSVLGGMLLSKTAITDVLPILTAEDFYRPGHGEIFSVVVEEHRQGNPADAVTIGHVLNQRKILGRLGGLPYLHSLIQTVPTAANAGYYAEIVAEKATLRRMIEAGTRIVQLAYHDVEREQIDDVILRAREAFDRATGTGAQTSPLTSLADLVCEPEAPEDWVVPDLLERGDRLILTGFEGCGKSTLTRQLALTVAAGVHPFTAEPLKHLDGGTQKVLFLDVENTRRQLRRSLNTLAAVLDDVRRGHGLDPVDWREAVQLIIRPDGIDLSKPAEIAEISTRCAEVDPDLLVAGPLYKLTGYNTHEEEGALKMLQTLDRLRVRHNCALVSEHHAGHAQSGQTRSTRPIGSSVLLRWPEFGLGLVPHEDHEDEEHPSRVKVRRWRGSREERAWPLELRHGGRNRLPWELVDE